MRSLVETSPVVFYGALEMSLPFLTGDGGICPILEEVIGRVESPYRWQQLLQSGSRTAREFKVSWGALRLDFSSSCTFLNQDLYGPLLSSVDVAGGECTDGSTRKTVTHILEEQRYKVISEALKNHPDRSARAVTAFQNFDKMSGAWILALPTPSTGLSGRVFSEAVAAHLCLPSPAIREWVGKPVGRNRRTIDAYADAVLNCRDIPGDSWKIRHDTAKLAIVNECHMSKLPVECEVYGLFADLIPAEALAEGEDLHWGRARQGLTPDFRLTLPTSTGPTDSLAELKFVGTHRGVNFQKNHHLYIILQSGR